MHRLQDRGGEEGAYRLLSRPPPEGSRLFARVAVCLPVRTTFHYEVPERLATWAVPGARCVVPFGSVRAAGFVVALEREGPPAAAKALIEVTDPVPSLQPELVRLGLWMSSYYHHPPGETLASMLPVALRSRREPVYRARSDAAPRLPGDGVEQSLWERLRAPGGLAARRLRPGELDLLNLLVKRGLAVRDWGIVESPPPRGETWVRLAPGAPDPEGLGARGRRQAEVLRALSPGPQSAQSLLSRGCSAATLRGLKARGWVEGFEEPALAVDAALLGFEAEAHQELRLTPEQEEALRAIEDALGGGEYRSFLLHGVTGSGKTEVYLRAARAARARGLGVLILVPEISLTPQLVGRFGRSFGRQLSVLHSGLGERERRLQWERVRRGDSNVVIGARSAVFAPLARLGLLVVDEEHEPSYKQEEGLRYHAKHVGLMRAMFDGAAAVLGSATPDVESYHGAVSGRHRRLVLAERIPGAAPPEVVVVDVRQEERRRRVRVVFSEPLAKAVAEALDRGEQSMLFLNRRGFSPALVCAECGQAVGCRNCSISMTLHRSPAGADLLCHYCGSRARVPERCPACLAVALGPAGMGTQRLSEAAERAWPGARILRLDRDQARNSGGAPILGAFARGEADVLVGTQMIAKGHHFPRVTVVGVVDADLSLHFPDFRSAERTFQVLTQVGGRAGRAERPGRVFLQTRNPHHPVIGAVLGGDYDAFAELELRARREAGFPPFRRLALFLCSGSTEVSARAAAEAVAEAARKAAGLRSVDVWGPAPAPLERIRGRFRFQVLLRAAGGKTAPLGAVISEVIASPAGSNRGDVSVHVDVDPVSLL